MAIADTCKDCQRGNHHEGQSAGLNDGSGCCCECSNQPARCKGCDGSTRTCGAPDCGKGCRCEDCYCTECETHTGEQLVPAANGVMCCRGCAKEIATEYEPL